VKNWLVTGGCGFIGVNLVRTLVKEGRCIRVLDNLSVGSRDDLKAVTDFTENGKDNPAPGKVELMVGDIRNEEDCRKAVRDMEVVVHLAAQTGVIPSIENPAFDCDQNVKGILNMLLAARDNNVGKFIMASSAAPLGEQEPPLHEKMVPVPLAPYGASKLAGEAYCSAFHASYGLDTVVLRFSNVYGPYSFKKGSVVALFFRRALAGKALIIYGDGEQTRDFIHSADLCRAIVLAAEKDASRETFQVATGRETTVNELAGKIKSLVERDSSLRVQIIREPPRKGEIIRNCSDISKARRMLGYDSKIDLRQGLEETWQWFRQNPKATKHAGKGEGNGTRPDSRTS
jgi:UDP-glucose 4-epimerase